MENKFDVSKVLEVPINEVCFNNWNPKQKRTKEFEKVKESIKSQGFLNPLIVREIEDEDYKYQILDGEQKFSAALDLGIETVPIYNLGKMSDEKAKQITIFMMQHVEADKEQLGSLLVELIGKVDLPYTDEEIELMSGIELEDEDFEDDFEEKSNFVKFSVSMIKDWTNELKSKIKQIQNDFQCSEGVAVYYLMTQIQPGEVNGEEIARLSGEESEKQF